MSAEAAPLAGAAPTPLWRHPAFLAPLAVASGLALSSPLWWPAAKAALYGLEFAIAARLPAEAIAQIVSGTALRLWPA